MSNIKYKCRTSKLNVKYKCRKLDINVKRQIDVEPLGFELDSLVSLQPSASRANSKSHK